MRDLGGFETGRADPSQTSFPLLMQNRKKYFRENLAVDGVKKNSEATPWLDCGVTLNKSGRNHRMANKTETLQRRFFSPSPPPSVSPSAVSSSAVLHDEARLDAVGSNLRRIHGMAYDRQRVESAWRFGSQLVANLPY